MENDSLDLTFQALADHTRRAVIARLMQGPATVSDLAEPFAIGLPAFLKHLKVLEKAGWIRTEKAGRVRTCHAIPDRCDAAWQWLLDQRVLWDGRTDRLAQYVETHLAPEDIP